MTSSTPTATPETCQPGQVIAEGKTKVLSISPENPHWVEVRFKDDATAFNGVKHASLPGKGLLNSKISKVLFQWLNQHGIPTCYAPEAKASSQEGCLVYQKLQMIPLEVVVRNIAFGSLCKRFPMYTEGQHLSQPVIEFYLKDDKAGDPLLVEDMISELKVIPRGVCVGQLKLEALRINSLFQHYFNQLGIDCADFKLEFGVNAQGQLMLGDELSPDNFRLRDPKTHAIYDKDLFRFDKGDLMEGYQALYSRMMAGSVSPLSVTEEQKKLHFTALVQIRRRPGILNPEGKTILDALHSLGYKEVDMLDTGKWFTLDLTAGSYYGAEAQLQSMAENLLSNPVIEDVSVLSCTLNRP